MFDYGFGFLFLLALELILNVYHHKTLKAITLIAGLLLISYAALYLLTFHAGLYVDPIPVGATAVAIKLLGLTYDLVKPGGTGTAPTAV